MPFVGIGVGIGRQRFAQGGIFAAYAARVAADGGVTEAGACVNAVSGISLNSSLLLVPSGYKSGVVYSQIPTNGDGDLTFTRASDATRVNSDGEIEVVGSGVPRLDYSQGSCPALLLEPQRTNLALYSEEFDNASWTQTGINRTGTPPFINQTIAPDGTTTADKLIEDTSTGQHNLRSNFINSTTSIHTFSVFAKKSDSDIFGIRTLGSGLFAEAIFDLDSGTVISTSGSGSPSASIVEYPNGWYRCVVTATPDQTIFSIRVALYDASYNVVYTGDGTSGVFIWGAQVEQGAYATSYIPTTSATVTRLADAISPITSTNTKGITNNYNTSVFIEVDNFKQNTLTRYFVLLAAAGANNPRILLYSNNTSPTSQTLIVQYRVTGQADQSIISAIFPISTKIKAAVILNGTNLTLFLNGVKVGTTTIVQGASIDQLNPLMDNTATDDNSHRVSAFLVFPNSLTDSQAIELTTL